MASFYLDADELKGAMNNVRLLFLEFPLTLAGVALTSAAGRTKK